MTRTESLQLLSRYSLPPNSLGYCGKGSAPEKFKLCIIDGICDGIEEELTHFIVLHPYLKTISALSKKDKFDYEVGECFWLGNDLINSATIEHYELLLNNFIAQGIPDSFVKELRQKKPKQFIPFHLFQVLHVGVGKSSGAVPFNLETINNCMIRWGRVTSIENNFLTADLNSVEIFENKYRLTKIPYRGEFNSKLVPNLKVGDTISIHWGVVNKILTEKEEQNLSYWSQKTVETVEID
ncbi:hypothetical protein GYA27_00835 [candidate division WWE3 bacterium]|uniref:Uncharacterized protein n=1 Tax=candidate division WWE3 bacterium TaxID=2053526 RepID=A0A7X9DJP6_UNCKA|nr:hypothetical protein [candidate division WWE3 bacterium]